MLPEEKLRIQKEITQLSAQAKRDHVRNYESTPLSPDVYAKRHQLSPSAFKTWITQYGKRKSLRFIPVQSLPLENKSSLQQNVEILLPQGIKVIVQELNNLPQLINLIQGLQTCN